MQQFQGVEQLSVSREQAVAHLTDAGWLAHSLPGATVREATPHRAIWRVRPQLAFAAGELETTAEVVARTADTVNYRLVSQGVGSGSVLLAELRFSTTESGTTTVHWSAELAELKGLLKLVPAGLIQSAAQKVMAEIWAGIHQKLTTPDAG
ncbi:MAG: hypothetical protein LC104_09250 [Bacteroidales bacterium]|nr:hypothetical protein [Bacteroidales bacterium]